MTTPLVFDNLLVVEVGARVGVAACGTLLAQLGADVVLVESVFGGACDHKWRNRPVIAAGKRSLVAEGSSDEVLIAVLENADVVLVSSDVSTFPVWRKSRHQIVCDITACGASGPLANRPYSDRLVQALTGVADTTGSPLGPPTVVGFEVLEFSAGIYAASAVLAALRGRRQSALGQKIEVALFDCGVAALTAFLPMAIVGKQTSRAGNAHSLTAPWNAYHAADGWILICTATDEQWRRLKTLIGNQEPGFDTNPKRVARVTEADAIVQSWVARKTVSEAQSLLSGISIPCGPILTVEQVITQENLIHRDAIIRCIDPVSNRHVFVPGAAFKATISPGRKPTRIPLPDEDREVLRTRYHDMRHDCSAEEGGGDPILPLAGIRVVEIGQFTAAPLAARQLGALGAEVIKVEPPGGEGSRQWGPKQGDQSYFFTFNNSDKNGIVLDLEKDKDKQKLLALLKCADILVENLKPGALRKFGFDLDFLKKINPRLIYCAISGFGNDSIYPGRPAFDTVLQAMCGVMDLTRWVDIPTKTGISTADVLGGEYALFSILAALEYRDRTGVGQFIDLAMQEIVAWITQMEWGRPKFMSEFAFVQCIDGYIAVEGSKRDLASWLVRIGVSNSMRQVNIERSPLIEAAILAGLTAVSVNTVEDVLSSPHLVSRELIVERVDSQGILWPLLSSPMRLSLTPATVSRPMGGRSNYD